MEPTSLDGPSGGHAVSGGVQRNFHESYPVGNSQSNGIAERVVQSIEGQLRSLKDAFEKRTGTKITSDHDIIPWMVEFAAVLLNRYEVASNGKTACERLRGKQSEILGMEFGQRVVLRKPLRGSRMQKMDIVLEDGVYLGHRTVRAESIIGRPGGIFRCSTGRRVAFEQRWNGDLSFMVGLPWKVSPEQDEAEQGLADPVPPQPSEVLATVPLHPTTAVRDFAPRRFDVTTKNIDPAEGGIVLPQVVHVAAP